MTQAANKVIPSMLSMFNDLIACPSVSSTSLSLDQSNLDVINTLADWLDTLGFQTEIIPLENTQKANLIATLGSGPGGLVLAGHTDTVPYNDNLWQVNPLALTEKDNRLYGLGSTDMKGFFPIVIEAVKAYLDVTLKQPLIILATADEESSMDGARLLAELGKPKARYAVIGEPTSLKPIRLHKGIMMESIRIMGRSGHSSDPALGKNAMEVMYEVLQNLLAFREQLQREYQHPGLRIQVPTLNLGCIHGGDNPNRICGSCELHFDLRCVPGMDNNDIRGRIQLIVNAIAQRHQVEIHFSPLIKGVNCFEEAADSVLIKTAERLTGHGAEGVAFATEAPFLQALGMETVVMGPGSIDQAHQPDEYMALDQVRPAIEVIKSLIGQFCL